MPHERNNNVPELYYLPTRPEGQLLAVSDLIYSLLQTVSEDYGDGMNPQDQQPNKRWLEYHNLLHSVEVYETFLALAERAGLSRMATAVGAVAAAGHDIIQEGTRGDMEYQSGVLVGQELANLGFSKYWQVVAHLAVIGTEPTYQDGVMAGQKVTKQQYPSPESEQIARLVATADMASVYGPRGPLHSHQLYLETYAGPVGVVVPQTDMPALHEFQHNTLDLVKNYQYPHLLGVKLSEIRRNDVVAYHKLVLEQIGSGEITDWKQLLIKDRLFADCLTDTRIADS